MIKSMAEDKTGEWIAANCLPDCLFIRPSGNPFKAAEFVTFFGGDVEITEKALIKIQKLDVGADMAWATASESAKFTYKGQPNDDPSFTVSSVWKKVGGAWKLAHGAPVHGHGQRHVVVGRPACDDAHPPGRSFRRRRRGGVVERSSRRVKS